MEAREWTWDIKGDRDIDGPICKAEVDPTEDLKDDSTDEDATEAGFDESSGVHSDAGGSPVLVLASRLQTGQKVLHDVSQESTQKAWNSVEIPEA